MVWFDYIWEMMVMAVVITGGIWVYKAVRKPDKD
jgi:hypothetical protein